MKTARSKGLRAFRLLALAMVLSAQAAGAGEAEKPAAPANEAAAFAALADEAAALVDEAAALAKEAATLAAPDDEAATLAALAPGLSRAAITEALAAIGCAKEKGIAPGADRLAIVDYTRSSQQQRLWIFDLPRNKVLFQEFVAHGKGSGLDIPTEFSNRSGSHQTSLGLFLTDETYEGGNGYSLKLLGLNGPLNDRALKRRIVMHGAGYVDPEEAREVGRLGRSFGCPALRPQVVRPIIDTLKQGQFLYAYGPGSAAAKKCETVALASQDKRVLGGRSTSR